MCLGKTNYDAYKSSVGGKAWNGDDMKTFEEMPQNIQNAWGEGADAVEKRMYEFDEISKKIRWFLHDTVKRLSEELSMYDTLLKDKKEELGELQAQIEILNSKKVI